LVAYLSTPALAQERPILVSPEVRADRTVVFRLWAPQGTDVQLSGSWMGPQPPAPLTKGTNGVWSVTVGPLPPNIYSYAFLVDGVRAGDPSCRCSYTSASLFAESMFTIRSEPPLSWELQNRPLGTLHHERFFSARQQRMRRFVVYTPPGYEPSADREYPLLVLLPGTPGDERDWTSGGGFADVMFDNLIADGRMVPMVVVMHASDVLDPPDERRGDENLRALETVLVNELIPLVRQRYRVSTDPKLAAIAGLSLGGSSVCP
jgi:enterochelin esterase family protein